MKKLSFVLGVFVLLILAAAIVITPAAAEGPLVVDLIAGQHTHVGSVTVNDDGTNLSVTYSITEAGFCLAETHLYVGSSTPKKGAPGKFPYAHSGLDCTASDNYIIPLSDLGVGAAENLYVAAHAVVLGQNGEMQSGLADLIAEINSVSNPIQMTKSYQTLDGPARWKFTISGAGSLDGMYDGWCANPPDPMAFGVPFSANMSVSLDPPWTYVNYIVNHYRIGAGSPYSKCDIQQAIHYFLHGYSNCDFELNEANRDAIIADATANGSDFVPGCYQVLAVFLDAEEGVQDQLILMPVPCKPKFGQETGWALNGPGAAGFKGGWGQYFQYTTNS